MLRERQGKGVLLQTPVVWSPTSVTNCLPVLAPPLLSSHWRSQLLLMHSRSWSWLPTHCGSLGSGPPTQGMAPVLFIIPLSCMLSALTISTWCPIFYLFKFVVVMEVNRLWLVSCTYLCFSKRKNWPCFMLLFHSQLLNPASILILICQFSIDKGFVENVHGDCSGILCLIFSC
jgi:hypothetical protein